MFSLGSLDVLFRIPMPKSPLNPLGSARFTVKIGDFGVSAHLPPGGGNLPGMCPGPEWAFDTPPEHWRRQQELGEGHRALGLQRVVWPRWHASLPVARNGQFGPHCGAFLAAVGSDCPRPPWVASVLALV